MSRSRFYRLRQEKRNRKIQMANDTAACQYAKIILAGDVRFCCKKCMFYHSYYYNDDKHYYDGDFCKNKYRIKKGEYKADLPEEKFCGFFKEQAYV